MGPLRASAPKLLKKVGISIDEDSGIPSPAARRATNNNSEELLAATRSPTLRHSTLGSAISADELQPQATIVGSPLVVAGRLLNAPVIV
jgi:hypothetical protein